VAEVNARTVEEEAYALRMAPERQENLTRIVGLLQSGRMEIRSAPLGGWSPDFSVFSHETGPRSVLLGLHWFQKPFPHRGPAWATLFGEEAALRAQARFREIWEGAHDIGPAILRLMERAGKSSTSGARNSSPSQVQKSSSSGAAEPRLPASRGSLRPPAVDTFSGPG
jgi:hypothetical protein